jgi:unsaturated rhamnogalacturonyl hydrolase
VKTSGLDETELTWAMRMADSTMERYPLLSRRWHYEPGLVLLAIRELWLETGEGKYYDYVKKNIEEC